MHRIAPVLIALLLATPVVRPQEPAAERVRAPARAADPATVLLPAEARFVVRLPSLERLDAMVAEMRPLIDLFGSDLPVPDFSKTPASRLVLERLGFDAAAGVDRTRPIYVAIAREEPWYLFPGSERTLWDGRTGLTGGMVGEARGSHLVVSRPGLLDLEARSGPVALIDGDVVAHLDLGGLIADHREDIGKALDDEKWLDGMDLPEQARGLAREVMGYVRHGIDGIEALQYGLTIRDGDLFSEGIVRFAEGSVVRGALRKGGEPGDPGLAGFLPRRAFLAGDGMTDPTWGMDALRGMLERHFGEGTSKALLAVLGPGAVCNTQLTGRSAFAMSIETMMPSTLVIYEVRDGAKADALIRGIDAEAVNTALESLQLPMRIDFEPEASTYLDIPMHRMLTTTDAAQQLPMFAQQESYLAVVDRYLLVSGGPTPESALKSLIDRVRAGDAAREHPHLTAMRELHDARSFGLTVNFGAVKPLMMMGAMIDPDVGRIVQAVPDEMSMSTAFLLDDGQIRWFGDWPVQELSAIARRVMELERARDMEKPEGEPEPGREPDFD